MFLIDKFPKNQSELVSSSGGAGDVDDKRSLSQKIRFALQTSTKEAKLSGTELDTLEQAHPVRGFNSSFFWRLWEKGGTEEENLRKLTNHQNLQDRAAYLIERATFERVCEKHQGTTTLLDRETLEALNEYCSRRREAERSSSSDNVAAAAVSNVVKSRSAFVKSQLEFSVYGAGNLDATGDATQQPEGKGTGDSGGDVAREGEGKHPDEEEKKETIVDIRKREIGDLHRQLMGLNRTIGDLKEEMAAKLEAIAQTEKEIHTLQRDVQQLSGEHSIWKEAVGLASNGEDLEGTLAALKQEVEALEGELAKNNEDWLQMKSPVLQEIERMRSIDAQKKERRDQIARQTAEMKQKVKKLQIDLRHKKQEKLQLQEQYKTADKSLNRYTYVQRIGEIIKNVKKQEVEIQRILADTLQVQREINSAEESLQRAYTLADEVIFREAKSNKSVASKDLYQLLSEVHSNFAQVVERIRAIGKMDKESQDCMRKTEELLRTPFADKIQKARSDLDSLNQEIANLRAT